MHPNAIDITGQLFGRLTALYPTTKHCGNSIVWICKCLCGTAEVPTSAACLRSGNTKSCGCLQIEAAAEIGRSTATHGMKNTPEYKAYYSAKLRCNSTTRKDYCNYGGRGIKFLFISFEQWFAVLGKRPTSLHSVDRFPDNNGNYERGNVRWATRKQQRHNRRDS